MPVIRRERSYVTKKVLNHIHRLYTSGHYAKSAYLAAKANYELGLTDKDEDIDKKTLAVFTEAMRTINAGRKS